MTTLEIIVYIMVAIIGYLAIGLIPLMIHAYTWGKETHHSFKNRMWHIFHGNLIKTDGKYKGISIWITWILYPFFWIIVGILFIHFAIQERKLEETK